ncbi:MAG: PAS domain S-box protein [Actinobacteria bacterium]|nr:PAS domain S-box protein [Actinomycetota bacterium]
MASSEHDEAPDAGTASGAPVDSSSGSERSPELFEALVADNADMIAVIDEGGRFIFVSEAARRILGLDPEAMVGQDGFALIHPEDIGLAVESMATTVASGSGVREPLLLRLRQSDGAWRQVEILTNNLTGDERVRGLVITARDMTARHESERTAAQARDLFEQVFDRAPIGMAIVENDGTLRRVNSALATMLGSTMQGIVGSDLIRLAHPEDRRRAADHALAILSGEERAPIEVRFVRMDGDLAWARVTATVIRADDGSPLHAIVQTEDVTEQQNLRAELQRAATHDPLTGLLNRAGLESAYARWMLRPSPSAFLLVDLDGFKPVNDTYGHSVGDRLLQCIAGRLRDTLRDDATIARIGGDEFVVHVAGVADAERATVVGERIRAALASPFGVEGHQITVGGSVGVAFVERPVDLEGVLVASDRASYRAKHAGGNQVTLVTIGDARPVA